MKKILFVEDDVLLARIYCQKLLAEGFEVQTAEDGLVAVQRLREFKPDLVILDLLMPKLDGVDVLRFIRRDPALKDTRIIVFSNSFLGNMIQQVAAIGVEDALVKASITPKKLVEAINDAFQRPPRVFLTAETMAANLAGFTGEAPAPVPQPAAAPVAPVPQPVVAASPQPAPEAPPQKTDSLDEKRFAEQLPTILQSVRTICGEFLGRGDAPIEPRKIEDVRRKISFVTQSFTSAGRHQAAQLIGALEAMLSDMRQQPAGITDSSRHTIASVVAFLTEQVDNGKLDQRQVALQAKILIVDKDVFSSRAVALALDRIGIAATSSADPYEALSRLQRNSYAMVLMEIALPGLDGTGLCEQMRLLPAHERTPVIFMTDQKDFQTHVLSIVSGGNDLISKPILPAELSVKVLLRLLRSSESALPVN